jgi:hypothetical protein
LIENLNLEHFHFQTGDRRTWEFPVCLFHPKRGGYVILKGGESQTSLLIPTGSDKTKFAGNCMKTEMYNFGLSVGRTTIGNKLIKLYTI